MRGLVELTGDLVDALTAAYPTRVASISYRPGRVTCVVTPTDCEYADPDLTNGPTAIELTVQIHVLAASSGDQAVMDLLTHVDPICAIARQAGYSISSWSGSVASEMPEIVITATAGGIG